MLHVVDAAAQDPAGDYWAVREELRMYNPEYCQRPHVVVLNKMDLEDASELQEEVASEVCFTIFISLCTKIFSQPEFDNDRKRVNHPGSNKKSVKLAATSHLTYLNSWGEK